MFAVKNSTKRLAAPTPPAATSAGTTCPYVVILTDLGKTERRGLNLVVAAIILWNTVYLDRAATACVGMGERLTRDCLNM
jgi:hypothetical protein